MCITCCTDNDNPVIRASLGAGCHSKRKPGGRNLWVHIVTLPWEGGCMNRSKKNVQRYGCLLLCIFCFVRCCRFLQPPRKQIQKASGLDDMRIPITSPERTANWIWWVGFPIQKNVPSPCCSRNCLWAKKAAIQSQELNKKLQESHRDLEIALLRAESVNSAKTTFLNNMSHDIRTPMNTIYKFVKW